MKTSFDPKTHSYLIDGKPATGVTTIIGVLAKPALISWAARMATDFIRENADPVDVEGGFDLDVWDKLLEDAKVAHTKRKEAAGVAGTDMHALVEEYVKDRIDNHQGKPIAIDTTHPHQQIVQFAEWAVANVDHFLFSERRMFDAELFIAGTADFAYVGKDGKKYMADFKTSSGIYGIDYWLQTAAYRMLAEGEGDEPYDGAVVVRMGKDGSFEVQQLEEYVLYKEAFLACLTLYRLQAHNKPVVKEKTYPTKN